MLEIRDLHGRAATLHGRRYSAGRLASILCLSMNRNWRYLSLSLTVAGLALVVGCASAPAVGSRPSPFPRSPDPAWADGTDSNHALAVHALLQTATGLIGSPYRLGGTTPQSGFDCSGFVRYVFEQYRVHVPRTAAEQFLAGLEIGGAGIASGDLIFFSTTGAGVTHVGIVVDPDAQTFVHAPGTGAVVRVERFSTSYWAPRTVGVRRVSLDKPSS